MSQAPPPPPPPHGENPKTTAGGSGLPPGKYDIFIIPEHSAGSGFLYLPSLQPNINSFVAGFASALALVVLFQSMAPALQAWWRNFQGMGNMGIMMLMVAIALGAWSLGRQQQDGPQGQPGARPTGGHQSSPGGGYGGTSGHSSPPPPNSGPPPQQGAPPPQHPPPPPPPQQEAPQPERPKPSWGPPPTSRAETPKGSWEKAREETRKREEERKAKEAEQKRKEDAARRLRELREREAREREQREKEAKEKEAKDRQLKEQREKEQREKEQREKELRERLERETREKIERELREKAAKEQEEKRRKEEEEKNSRKGSTYAYSSVGEKTSMWPNGRPPAASSPHPTPSPSAAPRPAAAAAPPTTPSSTKKPPAPTANSFLGTEEEAYSYRPYDKPKKPAHKKSVSDFSETSWAPSQSTSRTTPPPSMRAPYSTKDPDKIVIKAVYGFLNQFSKTPASQLISGIGPVTDGLILRITTEGLFIDDDVRGVAQREWDVKAWTLKLAEVWCPTHELASSSAPPSGGGAPSSHPFFKTMPLRPSNRDRGGSPKTLTGDDADAYLEAVLRACKDTCRLGLASSPASGSAASSSSASFVSATSASTSSSNTTTTASKTAEWKPKGLHLLRATIRDQEGKRYLFVMSEEESWKVAVGLQRLRRGTQVRQLGVASFGSLEAKNLLETLGWNV